MERQRMQIKWVNPSYAVVKRSLFGLIGLALLVIVIDQSYLFAQARRSINVSDLPSLESLYNTQQLAPLSEYLEVTRKSDLFGLNPSEAAAPVVIQHLETLTKDLRLRGIVIIDAPQAVVHHVSEQKDYFLKEGDTLGELTVVSIGEDKITLASRGEEIDLRLVNVLGGGG